VKSQVKLEGEELEEYYREQREKEKEKIEKLKKSAELEYISLLFDFLWLINNPMI